MQSVDEKIFFIFLTTKLMAYYVFVILNANNYDKYKEGIVKLL